MLVGTGQGQVKVMRACRECYSASILMGLFDFKKVVLLRRQEGGEGGFVNWD